MKNVLSLLCVLLLSGTTWAQEKSKSNEFVSVTVGDAVRFKELPMVGASTEPLVIYSAYGASRSATYNFTDVTVGNMKNCMYSIRCEGGKIKSVYVSVQSPEAIRELQAYANAHFGQPVQESLNKKDGVLETAQYIFDQKGVKANLSVITDKHASLAVN